MRPFSTPSDSTKRKPPMSGEADFVAVMTRQRLADWADRQVRRVQPVIPEADLGTPYLDLAATKGWVTTRRDGVTAAGFKTAAAFLRR